MAGLELFGAIVLLVLLGILAVNLGVDSRDFSTDPRRTAGPASSDGQN